MRFRCSTSVFISARSKSCKLVSATVENKIIATFYHSVARKRIVRYKLIIPRGEKLLFFSQLRYKVHISSLYLTILTLKHEIASLYHAILICLIAIASFNHNNNFIFYYLAETSMSKYKEYKYIQQAARFELWFTSVEKNDVQYFIVMMNETYT